MTSPRQSTCVTSVLVGLMVGASLAIAAPGAVKPAIDHDQLPSVPNDGFPQVEAVVESDIAGEEIRKARACFRAEQHPDFYCVDMKKKEPSAGDCSDDEDENVFVGVLPIPEASTSAIVYYIEATDDAFLLERTPSHTAATSTDPVGQRFPGNDPEITVIATVEDAPPVPPGFRSDGIVAFVSAAGVASAVGGGLGTTAVVGTVAAVGAAAAGVGVLAAESASTTTSVSVTSVPASTTTTSTPPSISSTSTIPPSASARACFTTMPSPANILTGESLRFDASCSTPHDSIVLYEWDFGDGRTGDDRVVSRVFRDSGVYSVTLTIELASGERDTRVRSVVVEDPNEADIRASAAVVANVPSQITYELTFVNAGPQDAPGTVFEMNILAGAFPSLVSTTIPGFSFTDCTLGATIVCRPAATFSNGATWQATVLVVHPAPSGTLISFSGTAGSAVPDPSPSNNVVSVSAVAALKTDESTGDGVRVTFTSELEATSADGVVNGRVVVDQVRVDITDNSSPFFHHVRGSDGLHVVEAFPMTRTTGEGRWRFDFRNTRGIVTGSLRVEVGDVVSLDATRVVFRLSGAVDRRVKFTYRLAR